MEMNDIKARIIKLSEMTVENGCSEQEAMSAANKMAALLDKYSLSLDELMAFKNNSAKATMEYSTYDNGRKNMHEVFYCTKAIGKFFECVAFGQKDPITKKSVIKFFGFPADVVAATTLMKAIADAMESDYKFWYQNNKHLYNDHGKTLRKSFMFGFVSRINERLAEMGNLRFHAKGTALVVIKNQVVKAEFDKLNMNIRTKKSTVVTTSNNAYVAGRMHGEMTNITNRNQIAD